VLALVVVVAVAVVSIETKSGSHWKRSDRSRLHWHRTGMKDPRCWSNESRSCWKCTSQNSCHWY
jgi:hypothetical protein